jgi:adenosylcobinamide-GDP ribazoletransferase
MRWFRAIILAFSTYTRIPVPQVKWDDEAMKLAIAFLPLVGIVIGGAVWMWLLLCEGLGVGAVLFAAVTFSLPVLITGGIHADGYCDTSDALASWQSRERRLEILKDPRIGAFALIRYTVYLLIFFALLSELYGRELTGGLPFIFVLSRCFAAWSAITMKNARAEGMLAAFTRQADKLAVGIILSVLTALALAGWLWPSVSSGELGQPIGLALCVALTLWYGHMAKDKFGGVTGDTTGFYLQLTELTLTVGLLVGVLV